MFKKTQDNSVEFLHKFYLILEYKEMRLHLSTIISRYLLSAFLISEIWNNKGENIFQK